MKEYKNYPFVQLHQHTHLGSRLDGISEISRYVEQAKENNHEFLAITDHGSLAAHYELQEQALKNDLHPLFGVEFYINDELETYNEKEKRVRKKDNHLITFAKNEAGYKNMLYLNYLSNKDTTHFYYNPRISRDELFEYSNGLIVGTACLASPFAYQIRMGNTELAEKELDSYLEVFKDNFYAEVQLNELTDEIDNAQKGQYTVNEYIIDYANRKGVPIVITGDVHYNDEGDDILQTISLAIRNKDAIDNLSFEIESKNLYYHTVNDYLKFNKEFNYNYREEDILKWADNSVFIANKMNHIIEKPKNLRLPKMSKNDDHLIVNKAREGLAKKLNYSSYEECPDNYKERLNEELELILRKGFSSYFMILEDLMEYCEKNDIYRSVGRGSAASSLVAYALDITRIDPIRFDLLFSRFISDERSSDVVVDYWN